MRALIHGHRGLAAVLLAAALVLKALVPAGYMLASRDLVLTVSICADASGGQHLRQIAIPAKGGEGGQTERGKGECPWTGLGLAALSGADGLLLAIAVAFVLALGFAPVRLPELRGIRRLRPPLRGPPLAA